MGPYGLYLEGDLRQEIMTISTAIAIVASLRYGDTMRALDTMHRLASTQDRVWPAAPSEMSPDYGCIVQAWTAYGVLYPMVCQLFGIWPDAARRRITWTPQLPALWPEAKLQHVRVGDNRFDVTLYRDRIELAGEQPGWTVTLPDGSTTTESRVALPRSEKYRVAPLT
ncbi:MAG: hypothetical protein ACYCW6_15455 [Candidatus Xenobia bacterium]